MHCVGRRAFSTSRSPLIYSVFVCVYVHACVRSIPHSMHCVPPHSSHRQPSPACGDCTVGLGASLSVVVLSIVCHTCTYHVAST